MEVSFRVQEANQEQGTMIIFHSTKVVRTQPFLVFTNEDGATIDIPVDQKTQSLFLHHFHRLAPGKSLVENETKEGSKSE